MVGEERAASYIRGVFWRARSKCKVLVGPCPFFHLHLRFFFVFFSVDTWRCCALPLARSSWPRRDPKWRLWEAETEAPVPARAPIDAASASWLIVVIGEVIGEVIAGAAALSSYLLQSATL